MNLSEIRKLCDEMPPGPWTVPGKDVNTDDIIRDRNGQRVCGCCCCGGFTDEKAAVFVVTKAFKALEEA